MYLNLIKPFLDYVITLILLIITSPIFIITVLTLLILNKGQIFFIQKRPGRNERVFSLIKFKTMNALFDNKGNLLADEHRLTLVGRIIRQLSIDELPQLINVLKGEMSLVGPRPLLIEYLPLYDGAQRQRHKVKPGITGWSQINGRNAISWQDKFNMDIWYVNNVSFVLDLRIIMISILKVLTTQGVTGAGSVTMKNFNGN